MSIFTWNSETDFTLQKIQSKTSKTFLEELQDQENAMQNLNLRETQKAVNEMKKFVLCINVTYFKKSTVLIEMKT